MPDTDQREFPRESIELVVRYQRLNAFFADYVKNISRGGTFVAMPLARQELADLTGTTIETTIRIMSRWQKDGVLLTEKDGFVVVDRATLETVAAS